MFDYTKRSTSQGPSLFNKKSLKIPSHNKQSLKKTGSHKQSLQEVFSESHDNNSTYKDQPINMSQLAGLSNQ